jgi:hypothetical protein
VRYPIDHFGCFWPEHIDHIAHDQLDFLRRHMPNPRPSAQAVGRAGAARAGSVVTGAPSADADGEAVAAGGSGA